MPTLYVENIPEDLYAALKIRARGQRSSIAQEIIRLLEQYVPTPKEIERRRFLKTALRQTAKKPLGLVPFHRRRRCLETTGVDEPGGVGRQRAVKWFLPWLGEGLVDEASDLLRWHGDGEIEFTSPDLLWPEFGNVVWKAVRLGRWSSGAGAKALQQMRAQRLIIVPSADLIEDALPIAVANHRTVHDSLYIAPAVQSGAEFVTADERLANAIAARLPVKWLGAI